MDGEKNPVEESDENTRVKQRARSFLRERFLRLITNVVGTECSLHMYSNTNLKGTFRGSDLEFDNLLLEKLKTPFAEIPHAIIRASDVHYIEF